MAGGTWAQSLLPKKNSFAYVKVTSLTEACEHQMLISVDVTHCAEW